MKTNINASIVWLPDDPVERETRFLWWSNLLQTYAGFNDFLTTTKVVLEESRFINGNNSIITSGISPEHLNVLTNIKEKFPTVNILFQANNAFFDSKEGTPLFDYLSQNSIKDTLTQILSIADYVIVSNFNMANYIKPFNQSVLIIPSLLPRYIFKNEILMDNKTLEIKRPIDSKLRVLLSGDASNFNIGFGKDIKNGDRLFCNGLTDSSGNPVWIKTETGEKWESVEKDNPVEVFSDSFDFFAPIIQETKNEIDWWVNFDSINPQYISMIENQTIKRIPDCSIIMYSDLIKKYNVDVIVNTSDNSVFENCKDDFVYYLNACWGALSVLPDTKRFENIKTSKYNLSEKSSNLTDMLMSIKSMSREEFKNQLENQIRDCDKPFYNLPNHWLDEKSVGVWRNVVYMKRKPFLLKLSEIISSKQENRKGIFNYV